MRLYTAVHDPASLDLRCARLVADQLEMKLVEVEVPAPTADDLAETVRRIEMPSKAQTEIAFACLHLARAMAEDGIKVVFSGEGSDEMWASYNNAWHSIDRLGWFEYRRSAFVGQHRKNFARCNKVFMAYGVECRLPFLHPPLVDFALRLGRGAVFGPPPTALTNKRSTAPKEDYSVSGGKEKMVLRQSFVGDLPDRVVGRDKLAFQTGAGLIKASAAAVADPQRFYRAEYARAYPGVKW
jgi:asparagine synthase (glutamine-hydrolysing)